MPFVMRKAIGVVLAHATLIALASAALTEDAVSAVKQDPKAEEIQKIRPAAMQTVSEAKELNTGQDPTKPLKRFDLRFKYQNLPADCDAVVTTLRMDMPIPLGKSKWTLGTRFDVPVVSSDGPSLDNKDGDWRTGAGDSLIQALAITPPVGRWQFGFGSQFIFPTGSEDQMGSGKWQLAPTAAGIYALPGISKGSFAGLLVKNQFSVAGKDDRRDVNDLVIQPILNVNLPHRCFATFAPELRIDIEDVGDVFVPLDLTVGGMINPKTVLSIEGKVPLVDDYKQYEAEIEVRIGFFF